ncbi:MAG: methyltransferase, partial [Oligoflexia bacterium]|nr:methyltransferase [Oligoflexia bacterium]
RVEGRANVVGSGAYREGAVEVQDLSSQDFVAAIAAAHPLTGARVLDLCAGAGGKSLAMAALGARVQAWDRRARALNVLRKRARRAGHDIHVLDPGLGSGPTTAAERYDIVVVDAPCSGSGRLMREPALRLGLEPDRYIDVQAHLLKNAATRVRPGGLLAYATCSLLACENQHPTPVGFTLVDTALRWPHRQPGDGFAWRLWRRSQAVSPS